ncbi:MAG: hypothetical protein H0X66_18150 [Verrucomicrobia bacterium]|nr:hypothetical protein [Verrucomicrobiota bacterium]
MEQAVTKDISEQNTPSFQPSTDSKSETPATPISDFVARADFPDCARGALVNIGGYTGLVVDIVGNSLKVRSDDETTMSFNCHVLRRLYAPREELKPRVPESETDRKPESRRKTAKSTEVEPEPEPPKRNIITEPNFDLPIKPIRDFTGREDFPQCTFGVHVDIGDYKGVVVEIVKGSLKVRSPEEVIRSYNSQVLRKLYPPSK